MGSNYRYFKEKLTMDIFQMQVGWLFTDFFILLKRRFFKIILIFNNIYAFSALLPLTGLSTFSQKIGKVDQLFKVRVVVGLVAGLVMRLVIGPVFGLLLQQYYMDQ